VTVSKLLGHLTLQTTMRYVHLVRSLLHEAVNLVSVTNFGGKDEKVSRTTTTLTTTALLRENGLEV
jgi:hypothetical protein